MQPERDIIEPDQRLLAVHRRRLVHLFQQQVQLGAYTPPYIVLDIEETQATIRAIKMQLRNAGIALADEPNDEAPSAAAVTLLQLTPQEQRNRRAMLVKVRSIWIEGLLEQSIDHETRIALDLIENPDAVVSRLASVVQELNRPAQPLSPNMRIIDVFDQMGGELLILGAPGAGKTTLLLELTRDLIARAEKDDSTPMPVVFNLSTWGVKRLPINQWFIDELCLRYDVPYQVAEAWIRTEAVLPLLDGLDEVAIEYRDVCADCINQYRDECGFVPLAVCSRIADYEALPAKLRLHGAVLIQAITQAQVEAYLENVGDEFKALRDILRDDVVLWELLDTPLMLRVVALTYKRNVPTKQRTAMTTDERRSQLLDDYIKAMFQRRHQDTNYSPVQTMNQLSWLAQQLERHKQTVFYIERIQPDWLNRPGQAWYGLVARLLSVFIVCLGVGIGGGLVVGLVIAASVGLLAGAVACLYGTQFERIELYETLHWSGPSLRVGIRSGIVFGILGGLLAGLRSGLYSGLLRGLIVGTVGGIGFGLVAGLVVGLAGELAGGEVETKIQPNQGIRRSVRNWVIGGLISGFGGGFGGALIGMLLTQSGIGLGNSLSNGLIRGFLGGFIGGLIAGPVLGLTVGLNYGGRSVLQHYTLRCILAANGTFPLRLVPFLDHCVERVFLRRIGGGYIFLHRLLMEQFASLNDEDHRIREQ
jgi:Cdc6-like AAA superfamily ATPase